MLTYFHPAQYLHHPRTYLSRGMMRTPQEVPERPRRLLQAVEQLGFELRQPADFGRGPLVAVHDPEYLRFLEEAHREWKCTADDWGDEVMSNVFIREGNPLRGILAKAARYLADGSCPVGENTWLSAYWSAQCALAGAQALIDGDSNAYALCRPPGHHARKDAAGGFCYLNNVAIAAQFLRSRYSRVAILDVDMHHGQGIQEIFYARNDVFYLSIHGDPTNFYPVVAGYEDERGAGEGYGYNLNLPVPHGSAEPVFFDRLAGASAELRRYDPDVLVLALGFDIYVEDPQSQVAVTTEGFGRLGLTIGEFNLPTLIVQEGGYHLSSLQANAVQLFGSFLAARGRT
jgi:acetoin utilization deacetylase AcuC-like enzyme